MDEYLKDTTRCACDAAPIVSPVATESISLQFNDVYANKLPEKLEVLAKLFSVRFLGVRNSSGELFQVLLDGPEAVSEILQRLGFTA
jgi:hypothetical protein